MARVFPDVFVQHHVVLSVGHHALHLAQIAEIGETNY